MYEHYEFLVAVSRFLFYLSIHEFIDNLLSVGKHKFYLIPLCLADISDSSLLNRDNFLKQSSFLCFPFLGVPISALLELQPECLL